MTTAVFTTVEARVDQVLTNAIWADEIKDNGNILQGFASGNANLLVNGGFEPQCWQRGVGPFVFTAGNFGYTADRWLAISGGGTTSTITQETTIVETNSGSSLKYVTSGGTAQLVQKLEDYKQLRGQTVSFSARVRQSAAAAVTLIIEQTSGTTLSATSATTGSFVTLTVTVALASNTNVVQVYLTIASGATVYFDNAMLVIGPAPAPYRPLHPQEDLARCQRYYEVHGGVNNAMSINAYQAAGSNFSVWVPFSVRKGGTPTVTKNGTWGVTNSGQPGISAPSPDGYVLFATATALGFCNFTNNSSDDTVTSEFNP